MEKIVAKDRLKEKFSKVEIAFDDDMYDYKLTSDSVKNLKTQSEISRKKGLVSILWRGTKLVTASLLRAASIVYQSAVKKVFLLLTNKTKAYSLKVREKEESLEMYLDQTISEIEMVHKEKAMAINDHKRFLDRVFEIYKEDVQDCFGGKVIEHNVGFLNNDAGKIKEVFAFQAEIYQYISKRLMSSNMLSNIKSLSISMKERSPDVIDIYMNFELDRKGYLWASIFSKHFIPELQERIGKHEGKIGASETLNLTKNEDEFKVRMSFNSLELSVIKEQKTSPAPVRSAIKNMEL